MSRLPVIIQGGMGVAVSGWPLARAVSRAGQLGVVSGTALDVVLAHRLQLGDPSGEVRAALTSFPDEEVAAQVFRTYYVADGKPQAEPFAGVPMYTASPTRRRQQLAVVAGFVEVFLAKQGHDGPVGINFLEKIPLPTPATLYGALLAGVDYVLVGAGIPRGIPGLLDALCRHEPVDSSLQVTGAEADGFSIRFDPREAVARLPPELPRPRFLAIVASATLAASLVRHGGRVDGFVVEGPSAGGHNAPPRGPLTLTEQGEPVYGPRDVADLARFRALELPFWLGGSCASPERVRQAQEAGAAGVQVGTLFAFCAESGVAPELKDRVLDTVRSGGARVFTDPLASPTGFPFKVLELEGTLSEPAVYEGRERRCDLGYLRELYRRLDGTLGYRCPGEPLEDYVRKGGRPEDTRGRKCICNGLLATVGLGQWRRGGPEPAIVTSGDDLRRVGRLLEGGRRSYSAADVIAHLTTPTPTRAA